ncbi:MAG TPA: O-antigen ligase family protein [Pyrinomonadaceae bacterium]|nr:O-antigen ligase family protein [Pyrinomonadaceae bacterium]
MPAVNSPRKQISNSQLALANSEAPTGAAAWLDRLIILFLFVFAIAAPHSIAATQTAWLLGMFCWVVRFAFYPPPRVERTPVDYALIGFFILSGVSSFLSYEPVQSIGKMRAASLFTIVYLAAENIPSRRIVRWLTLALIASFTVNVCYTIAERAWGRGIKVQGVTATSPLAGAVFKNRRQVTPTPILSGDTVLTVDGTKISDASALAAALAASGDSNTAQVQIYRVEWTPILEVPRGKLLSGNTPEAQLGITSWSSSRDWRAAGFFGHYVTYAEALQLVLALVLGLFICYPHKRSAVGGLLLLLLAAFVFALVLTVTRATWIAALFSAFLILLLSSSRKVILVGVAIGLPLMVAGFLVLRQQRNINVFDRSDQSTIWRETVWREGSNLLISKPRHLLFGVGMDSIKAHRAEWGLFDNGRLPPGHMHSNLLQIGLERGVPALICWLVLLGMYARRLWRLARSGEIDDWIERGLILGALGGLCGFFISGLVHYNWGDSEVVMIFYFIMGLTLSLSSQVRVTGDG